MSRCLHRKRRLGAWAGRAAMAAQPHAAVAGFFAPPFSLSGTPTRPVVQRRSSRLDDEKPKPLGAAPTGRTTATGTTVPTGSESKGMASGLAPYPGEGLSAVSTYGVSIPGKKPADLGGKGRASGLAPYPGEGLSAVSTHGVSIPGKKPADSPGLPCACPGADRRAQERLANGTKFCGPAGSWFVYDSPYDFGPACRVHDLCYGPCSTVPRKTCDRVFKLQLASICSGQWDVGNCLLWAATYYGLVFALNGHYYEGCGGEGS